MAKIKMSNIPLVCSLCPKTPTFSDVSHLLTHISSKSHLSNRFKLQIQSQSDAPAAAQLDEFETWYADNQIDGLLAGRMAAKSQKKHTVTGSTSKGNAGTPSRRKRAVGEPRKKIKLDDDDHIEPLLKLEPNTLPESHAVYHPPIPRMHTWSTGTQSVASLPLGDAKQWYQPPAYEPPNLGRRLPNFGRQNSQFEAESTTDQTTQSSEDIRYCENTNDETETEDVDNSMLKGFIWPGMSIFDSATREQKRLRNQKKDGSVLAQMILTAERIEPLEKTFTIDGELEKITLVFDLPTRSELELAESERAPSEKRLRARKSPLKETDRNSARLRAATKKLKGGKRKDAVQEYGSDIDPLNDDMRLPPRSKSQRISKRKERAGHDIELQEDMQLSMGLLETKQKGMGIFRDADPGSPGRTESPLESHQFDFPDGNDGLNPHGIMGPHSARHQAPSPTAAYKPITARYPGKENSRLMYQPVAMTTAQTGFPPRIFHESGHNPLYYHHGHSHGHVQSFPYTQQMESDHRSQLSSFQGSFRPTMSQAYPAPHGSALFRSASDYDFATSFHYRL